MDMKIIVIGAGPAGMMAAITAAQSGAKVTLLEKKEQPGKKLKITGKGRCNLTSALDMDEFMKGYAGNGRFLYSALNAFSNVDLMDFFRNRGLELVVERGQRVFPISEQAGDVVQVLLKELQQTGVELITSCRVNKIDIIEGRFSAVVTEQGKYFADAVIITTGGLSYPGTGSTGDGYAWAKVMGHKIIEPRPGLVPLISKQQWVYSLQGLSLRNVQATAYSREGKKIAEDFGEMLFTHFGVSGPIILSMSRSIGVYLRTAKQPVKLNLDLKPALTNEQLDIRIQRDLTKYARRQFKNSLDELLPQKLIPVIVSLSGIDPEKECNQITRTERLSLLSLLKALPIEITATRPIAEAIVTAGGVDVQEIDPRSMQSRLVQGVYFAGEILDVDGYTGGFNLQAAFSTGYVAGKRAAEQVEKAE